MRMYHLHEQVVQFSFISSCVLLSNAQHAPRPSVAVAMIILHLLVVVLDRLGRCMRSEILVLIRLLGRLGESGVNFPEGGDLCTKLT